MSHLLSSACYSSSATSGSPGVSSDQDRPSKETRKRLREAESNPELKLQRRVTTKEEQPRLPNLFRTRAVVEVLSSIDLLGYLMQFVSSIGVYRLATVSQTFSKVSKTILGDPCPSDASDDTWYRFPIEHKERGPSIGREETLTFTSRCYRFRVGNRTHWPLYLSDKYPHVSEEGISTACEFCKTTTEFGLFLRACIANGAVLDLIHAMSTLHTLDMHVIYRLLGLGVSTGDMSEYMIEILGSMELATVYRFLEHGVSLRDVCLDLVEAVEELGCTVVFQFLELGVSPCNILHNLVVAVARTDIDIILKLLQLGASAFGIYYYLMDAATHMDISVIYRLLELGATPGDIYLHLVDAAQKMNITTIYRLLEHGMSSRDISNESGTDHT
jgi:hypothetical protein